MKDAPLIPPSLITFLEENFPLNEVTNINTLEKLKFFQGQQNVIAYLRSLSQKQQKDGNILNVS